MECKCGDTKCKTTLRVDALSHTILTQWIYEDKLHGSCLLYYDANSLVDLITVLQDALITMIKPEKD